MICFCCLEWKSLSNMANSILWGSKWFSWFFFFFFSFLMFLYCCKVVKSNRRESSLSRRMQNDKNLPLVLTYCTRLCYFVEYKTKNKQNNVLWGLLLLLMEGFGKFCKFWLSFWHLPTNLPPPGVGKHAQNFCILEFRAHEILAPRRVSLLQSKTPRGGGRLGRVSLSLVSKVLNFGHIGKRIAEIMPVLPFWKFWILSTDRHTDTQTNRHASIL